MGTGGAGLTRGWAISGIGDQVREAARAAADEAGMPVSAWVERALLQALETKAEPTQPEGVEIGEPEAMVRRGVAEELRPREGGAAHAGPTAAPAPSSSADGSPVSLMRERRRQRRAG